MRASSEVGLGDSKKGSWGGLFAVCVKWTPIPLHTPFPEPSPLNSPRPSQAAVSKLPSPLWNQHPNHPTPFLWVSPGNHELSPRGYPGFWGHLLERLHHFVRLASWLRPGGLIPSPEDAQFVLHVLGSAGAEAGKGLEHAVSPQPEPQPQPHSAKSPRGASTYSFMVCRLCKLLCRGRYMPRSISGRSLPTTCVWVDEPRALLPPPSPELAQSPAGLLVEPQPDNCTPGPSGAWTVPGGARKWEGPWGGGSLLANPESCSPERGMCLREGTKPKATAQPASPFPWQHPRRRRHQACTLPGGQAGHGFGPPTKLDPLFLAKNSYFSSAAPPQSPAGGGSWCGCCCSLCPGTWGPRTPSSGTFLHYKVESRAV